MNKNHKAAWKYYERNGYADHAGLVLHHRDVGLKVSDPSRYDEWRVDDLTVMTRAEHNALHQAIRNHKGIMYSRARLRRHREAMRSTPLRNRGAYTVTMTRGDEELTYSSCADAARAIGATRQHVSQASHGRRDKRVRGWTVTVTMRRHGEEVRA